MIIKPSEIEIPESDPFANDRLERRECAEVLTELLRNARSPYVLALDSPWDTGKTTFIKMWSQMLHNQGVNSLYFNAWENDFSRDPFVSLVGEIGTLLSGVDEAKASKARHHYQMAKEIASQLVRKSLPVAVKIATAGALDLEKAAEETLAKLAEDIVKDGIEEHEAKKKTIAKFKEELEKYVQSLRSIASDKRETTAVFIIDELDQCRPDYAIELLERIKHLFNIKGLVFVLALDREQLGFSLQTIYDQRMNVDGYLRRFIDLDYRLPEPKKGVFMLFLFERYSISSYLSERNQIYREYEKENFLQVFEDLSYLFQLSLREQEQCFSFLSLVIATTPKDRAIFPVVMGILIVLKIRNAQLYRQFIHNTVTAKEILDFMKGFERWKEVSESEMSLTIVAELVTARAKREEIHSFIKDNQQILKDESLPEEVRENAGRTIALIQNLSQRQNSGFNRAEYLAKKIEIAERFIQP